MKVLTKVDPHFLPQFEAMFFFCSSSNSPSMSSLRRFLFEFSDLDNIPCLFQLKDSYPFQCQTNYQSQCCTQIYFCIIELVWVSKY